MDDDTLRSAGAAPKPERDVWHRETVEREKHWWALIAQPGVTMCWPIVQFWSEFVHFEWHCADDATNET